MSHLGPYALDAVHQGESLDLLRAVPDASVDMVCADSPYSSGGFTRGDRMADPRTKYTQAGSTDARISFTGDNRDQLSWMYWSALWFDQCRRILKPNGYALSFTDWRQLPATTVGMQAGGLVWRGVVVWDKGEGARAPHTGYFRHQCEYVAWGTNGPLEPAVHGGPWPGVIRCSVKQSDKHHLTGKPTDLLRQLVRACPPGGVILDPFGGSCTTLVAAWLEGRHAVCFELDPENVRIGRERLAAARAGVDFVAREAGQSALFSPEALTT